MEKVLAELMVPYLNKIIKKECFGCRHGCKSQRDHTCLTESYETQVLLYMEEALKMIPQTELMEKLKEIDFIEIVVDSFETRSKVFDILCNSK
jgi:hypothetical protein